MRTRLRSHCRVFSFPSPTVGARDSPHPFVFPAGESCAQFLSHQNELRYQKDLPQAGRDEWVMRSESENSEPTSPICEGGPEAYSFLVLS